jgi:hypothetical protein
LLFAIAAAVVIAFVFLVVIPAGDLPLLCFFAVAAAVVIAFVFLVVIPARDLPLLCFLPLQLPLLLLLCFWLSSPQGICCCNSLCFCLASPLLFVILSAAKNPRILLLPLLLR